MFLFTVHFFNHHFRSDKLPPPDIVMFTGTQSLGSKILGLTLIAISLTLLVLVAIGFSTGG
ncbi:hypothetical protein SCD_n02741 [Sulfuricella denitrificans skB26]|uniref:Uncharacterized protein n=1 Tax=Sulfuricella denitrificans (strain DSM 22764 / NBRC 105220 / skB26) TaxID=1163617 RepID=S6AJK7_SULDS|nr:hypothetical protein SCD_n02741 [Sulfuricella denitrificans skB26]